MPKRSDHQKALAELAKVAPATLKAITVRLPAGLLTKVHAWAEQKNIDLATAIREMMELGEKSAVRPSGQSSAVAAKVVKQWARRVERTLRAGRSPLELFEDLDDPSQELQALPAILGQLDYPGIYTSFVERKGKLPWVEREWADLKAEAPSHLLPLMSALDRLETTFDARKKVGTIPGQDGDIPVIYWLLSDSVMKKLAESSSDDADVEAVRKLIAARYLVADQTGKPWEYEWDD